MKSGLIFLWFNIIASQTLSSDPSASLVNSVASKIPSNTEKNASAAPSVAANAAPSAAPSVVPVAGVNQGSDCKAPSIFNACMERGQMMLSKCTTDDCSCRFTRALGLCFEQCKTGNPGQKAQLESSAEGLCAKLSPEQRSSVLSVAATPSSASEVMASSVSSLSGRGYYQAKKSASDGAFISGTNDSNANRFLPGFGTGFLILASMYYN